MYKACGGGYIYRTASLSFKRSRQNEQKIDEGFAAAYYVASLRGIIAYL